MVSTPEVKRARTGVGEEDRKRRGQDRTGLVGYYEDFYSEWVF